MLWPYVQYGQTIAMVSIAVALTQNRCYHACTWYCILIVVAAKVVTTISWPSSNYLWYRRRRRWLKNAVSCARLAKKASSAQPCGLLKVQSNGLIQISFLWMFGVLHFIPFIRGDLAELSLCVQISRRNLYLHQDLRSLRQRQARGPETRETRL